MSLIERLKLGSELKSTVSIGKLFQRFMTRSAKKLDLTELLQKYLKILYGWPLVEQDRNVKKSSPSTRTSPNILYNTTISQSRACDVHV